MIVIPTAFIVLYLLILFYTLCYLSAIAHDTLWIVLFAVGAGICALLLLLGAIRRTRAAISRICFVSKLRRRIRHAGGECRVLHNPLRAFFLRYAGADILIENGEKKYALKFFPGFFKNHVVHIADEKTAYVSKPFAMMFHRRIKQEINSGRGNFVMNDFGARKRKIDLTIPEEGKKIIIFTVPFLKITAAVANRSEMVDNDYEWQGMTFWYQKSFFKFLEQEGVLS